MNWEGYDAHELCKLRKSWRRPCEAHIIGNGTMKKRDQNQSRLEDGSIQASRPGRRDDRLEGKRNR